jgi:hypothetical protein
MTTVDFFNLLSDCDPKKSLIYKIEDDEYTIEAIHRINGKVLVFGFNNPYGNDDILDVSCLEQFLFNSDELPLYLVTIKEWTPSQIDTVSVWIIEPENQHFTIDSMNSLNGVLIIFYLID